MSSYTGDDTANDFVGEADRRNYAFLKGGDDHAVGGDLHDDFIGGEGNDTLDGAGGDDTLDGEAGDDVLFGGTGDDFLYGADVGLDQLIGGSGDDTIFSDQGDLVNAGTGDDIIFLFAHAGAALAEVLGGLGDDVLYGLGGHAAFDGGLGDDAIDYSLSAFYGVTTGVTVNLLSGRGDGSAEGDTYWLVENAYGSRFADRLIGNGSTNVLSGLDGDDVLAGGGGGDVLDGGTGVNTLDYRTSPGAVQVDLAAGTAYGGDAQEDIFRNIQSILGGSYGDTLAGDAAANTLRGNAGDDRLIGGDGADVLAGGAGKDRLVGGLGADALSGGTGADVFVFASTAETPPSTDERDRISDFSQVEGDRIDLSGIDANTAAAGNQAFVFIGSAAFAGNNGELRVVVTGGRAVIFGDINGDKVADFQILVNADAAHPFAATDFVL